MSGDIGMTSSARAGIAKPRRDGQVTQNSLPSGSRITMALPRTLSVFQAMLAPAWTSRSTCSLTSRFRSSPRTCHPRGEGGGPAPVHVRVTRDPYSLPSLR